MINTVRFAAALSLLACATSPLLSAADQSGSTTANPPPIVIERAPEADATQLQAELTAAHAENQRLTSELAALRAKAGAAATPVTRAPDGDLATTEKARADEATARLNTLTAGVDRLLDEKNALEAQLTELKKTEAALRQRLETAEKAATAATDAPEVAKKLADTEKKLEAAVRSYSLLQAENQLLKTSSAEQVRLAAELEKMRQEKASRDTAAAQAGDLKAKLADTEGKLATVLNSYSQLQRENDQLKTAGTNNQTASKESETLRSTNASLEKQVAELRDSEKALRQQLATAEKNASSAAATPDLSAKLAETETKLADATRNLSQLQRENNDLKKDSAKQAAITAEVEKLRSEKTAADAQLTELRNAQSTLREQLASAEKTAADARTAPAPVQENSATTAKLSETEARLETVLRSFTQLQAENDRLKNAASEQSGTTGELENLRRENATLQSKLAAAPQDNSSALASTQDKLNTVLRSYTLLQNENDRLKAEAAQAASAAQSSSTRAAGEAAAQISALYDELRQNQAQTTSLAAENAQLKTRLAIIGNPPGTTLASPIRPGSARAGTIASETPPAAEPAPAAPTPRTHHVVPGDSLAKISRTYYGTAGRWDEILNANRDVIKDENVLPIGATLRIP